MESSDQKRNIEMQEYHDIFIASIMLFLDIAKNSQKESISLKATSMINSFNNNTIDIEKKGSLIRKVFTILDIYYDLLKEEENKLFSLYTNHKGKILKVTIIPGIDISGIWDTLDGTNQKNVWNYIKMMYISTSNMIDSAGNTNNVVNLNRIEDLKKTMTITTKQLYENFWKLYPESKLIVNNTFNPFIGVGSNNTEYGLSDLLSGPKLLPDQSSPGINGITKMLGIDKMLNMDDLAKQLKNITKEQIDEATASIKSMLGDVDENTSELIDIMLTDITDEFKKGDISSGHPVDNFVKIAESVAHKMMPKIDKNKIDINKVWNSTRNMASKCQDKDGKPLFDGPNNPLSLVTGLMEKQMKMYSNNNNNNKQKTKKNETTEKTQPDVPDMTEDEYVNECQNILKQLGLPNISEDKVKNIQIDKLISDLNGIEVNPAPTDNKSNKSNRSNRSNRSRSRKK